MTASEAALGAALGLLAQLPGVLLGDEPDVAWLASGRPMASLNHVHRIRLAGDDPAIDARIDEVQAAVSREGTVPVTWWLGPATTPADLGRRLAARGLLQDEPEFGMVIALDDPTPRPAGEVVLVGPGELDEWLSVMGRSYGWSDPRAIAAWTDLYRGALDDPEPRWWHVLVRADGHGVACASLFPAGDQGFVTNVGTVPEARGGGHGTAATLATLDIARREGFRRASLTASLMGRSMYARIGFVDEARLDRFVGPGRVR